MVREILFRGKRSEGVWVFGYYLAKPILGQHFIISGEDQWMVAPETVGQYTGLTDKNGTKIFEGDIVAIEYEKEIVKYSKGGFFPFSIAGWECTPYPDETEIIGNTHDNPELLN